MSKIVENQVRDEIDNIRYDYQLLKTKEGNYEAKHVHIRNLKDLKIITPNRNIPLGEENPKETFDEIIKNAIKEAKNMIDELKGNDRKTTVKLRVSGDSLDININSSRDKRVHHKGFSVRVLLTDDRKKYTISTHLKDCPSEYERKDVKDHLEHHNQIHKEKLKIKLKPPFIGTQSNHSKVHSIYENIDDKIIKRIDDYVDQYD